MSKSTKARKASLEERNSEMRICPKCGAGGFDGKECAKCEFKGHGNCPTCGAEIAALAQPLCPKCGKPISEPEDARVKREAKEALQAEFDAKMKELDG
jgi:predicted amidophosphoribosyltransferase